MLVLTRKTGEAIVIGGNIVVRLLEVKGGRVRIGIEAPKEVHVDRSPDGLQPREGVRPGPVPGGAGGIGPAAVPPPQG